MGRINPAQKFRPVACVAICLLAAVSAASGDGRDRLIADFEKESVAKWNGEFRDETEDSYSVRVASYYSCEFTATKGPATTGQWALSKTVRKESGLWLPGILSHYNNRLFSTARVLGRIGPTDWSVFAALEFDVWSKADGDVTLVIALEDEVIQPPVLRRARIKGGGIWQTVRIPLAELRGLLDLKSMVNFWVIAEQVGVPTEMRMDNIRLAGDLGQRPLPVAQDDSPVAENHARLREQLKSVCTGDRIYKPAGVVQPTTMPAGDSRSFTAPAEVERFATIDITQFGKSYTRRTFDHGLEFFDDRSAILAIPPMGLLYTIDGGRNWSNLDGGAKSIVQLFSGETSWRCQVGGDRGDLLYAGLGKCCGGGMLTSLYFRRVVKTIDGWRPGPAWPVDRDTRHCAGVFDIVRLTTGRQWIAWDHTTRHARAELYARFSDDEGRTWQTAGPTGAIARDGKPGAGRPHLIALGENVVCLWSPSRHETFAAVGDGKSWAGPALIAKSQLRSAASPDGKTILAAMTSGEILSSVDSRTWIREADFGMPGVFSVQPRARRATFVWSKSSEGKTSVLLAWRDGSGKWSQPKTLATGEGGVVLSVPRISPEQFVPVAIFTVVDNDTVTSCQIIKAPTADVKYSK